MLTVRAVSRFGWETPCLQPLIGEEICRSSPGGDEKRLAKIFDDEVNKVLVQNKIKGPKKTKSCETKLSRYYLNPAEFESVDLKFSDKGHGFRLHRRS